MSRVDVTGAISTRGWGTPIYGTLAVESRFGLAGAGLSAGLGLGALAVAVRLGRRRRRPGAWELTVLLTGFFVAFTFAVGAIAELGEQARFRTMTDPLALGIGVPAALRLLASRFDLPWLLAPDRRPDQAQAVAVGR